MHAVGHDVQCCLAWLPATKTQPNPPTITSTARLVPYHEPVFGWSIRYPSSFQTGHYVSAPAVDMAADGAWVANFNANIQGGPARVGNASEVPDMTQLRSFPANGVALAIWYAAGGVQAPETHHTTALPIKPSALHQVTPYVGGSEPAPRIALIDDHGTDLSVTVWIGPHSTAADRKALWATLATLRFPPASYQPNGVVSGTVEIEGGPAVLSSTGGTDIHPLRHAQLIITGTTSQGDNLHRTLRTDAQGNFDAILPPGHYTVTALAYGPATRPLSTQPHSRVVVTPASFLSVRLTGHVQ